MRPRFTVLRSTHPGQLVGVDARLVVNEARGIRHRHHLAAELVDLLDRVTGDVARARNQTRLVREAVVLDLEHVLHHVDGAVAGGLGADRAAAVLHALTGQDPGEDVGEPLVLAEHVTDLAGADADIAGRHVGIGPDVAEQFAHERLAETHDLVIGLALGVEVGPPLSAAHRKPG
jgi:hypothetical protein